MQFMLNELGKLTLKENGISVITAQNIGNMYRNKTLYPPLSCQKEDDRYRIEFACGHIELTVTQCDGYYKLVISSFSGGEGFVFGPYLTPYPLFGDMIGAAYDEENFVCIQSLNPKTLGCFPYKSVEHPYAAEALPDPLLFTDIKYSCAYPTLSGTVLQCYVEDMSQPATFDFLYEVTDAIACEVPAEDASPVGGGIALFAGKRNVLLSTIEKIELAEGLPHPTIDGVWAKTSPRASESYIHCDFFSCDREKYLAAIKKSGIKHIYCGRPFKSWGHFIVDEDMIGEKGDEGLRNFTESMRERGFNCGFHTLTNFIETTDSYVTPVPDHRLLTLDKTVLVRPLEKTECEVAVAELKNFDKNLPINIIRIDKELICYKGFHKDGDAVILENCERGAYGTAMDRHPTGEEVCRLWSHSYMTLFPDFSMMREMEDRIGEILRTTGINRISFDGIEGCDYLGRGEYSASEFVRRCYEVSGSEVLSDASNCSHYRWHAHTYLNWGEPFYHSDRRGGMFRYRANNQAYFQRNFMPHMLGQYGIFLSKNELEATSPEGFACMMAQSVAHDAGLTVYLNDRTFLHGLLPDFLEMIRIWGDLRSHGDIPAEMRERMKNEYADWYIEETLDGWTVYEYNTVNQMHPYARFVANGRKGDLICLDAPHISSPLKMRTRVGRPGQTGCISDFGIYHCWGGDSKEYVRFPVTVHAGEYLIYEGGNTIEHRDANYQLLETVSSVAGEPFTIHSRRLDSIVVAYDESEVNGMYLHTKIFLPKMITHVKRK